MQRMEITAMYYKEHKIGMTAHQIQVAREQFDLIHLFTSDY